MKTTNTTIRALLAWSVPIIFTGIATAQTPDPSQYQSSFDNGTQSNVITHLAGYADVGYTETENDDGSFGAGRFAPIFHYQYRDLVLVEAELEVEIDEEGETETLLEYLSINYFINDYVTLVGGKFLSPIGQFRQNQHPSWINKLASAPPGFGHDGAAPVSDIGLQLRGGVPIANIDTNYAVYISNGPELVSEFEDDEFELDGVEAEGFGSDIDGEKVIGGRFAILPVTGLEIGLSAASGKATVTEIHGGDSSVLIDEGARDYEVFGADFAYKTGPFRLRGEYVETKVGETGRGAAASEGASWETWYTQASYRALESNWEFVARYTDFTSPHASQNQEQWAVGTNYLFTNNFIGKLTYEFNDGLAGRETDDDRVLFQLAYGF